jgi:hypothetical protein
MKITVRKKEPEVKQVYIEDVPVGYVFKIHDSCCKPDALKLRNNRFVLLNFLNEDDSYLEVNDGTWRDTSVEIVGKLTEIIVEE